MSKVQDLLEYIEFPSLECLNEQPQHSVANALKQGYREDDGLYLESDADEQLLVNIAFHTKVRIHSITIKGPSDGTAPRRVKLYVNRASLGFSDVGSLAPAQEFVLTSDQVAGEPVPLKLVKFQHVGMLSVFVEDNQGGEETTRVLKLVVTGVAGDTFNVAEIKKQNEEK